MKYIVHKPYWNYEKEENWLNEMSSKGMALTGYSWCRYVFEECKRDEYTYRIELLKNSPRHPESIAYIHFLEETGIEHIASYINWVYFRKKTEDGPFDLYSDIDSKIKHYKRINHIWISLTVMELVIGIMNAVFGLIDYSVNGKVSSNLTFGPILIFLGIFFATLVIPIQKKIKYLKNEKTIRE
jgi:hypothetical protein